MLLLGLIRVLIVLFTIIQRLPLPILPTPMDQLNLTASVQEITVWKISSQRGIILLMATKAYQELKITQTQKHRQILDMLQIVFPLRYTKKVLLLKMVYENTLT